MLPKLHRLRKTKDFALLSQKGHVVFASWFTVRLRRSAAPTKIGFVASTKLFKSAVSRNRVKRRMREALRALRAEWPVELDLLFILKPEVMTVTFEALKDGVRRAFQKIPDALMRPPSPRPPRARKKSSVVFRGGR